MTSVIGVRFKKAGKVYYFAPGQLAPAVGDYVIVETARGEECGEVAKPVHEVPDSKISKPLRPALRMADAIDPVSYTHLDVYKRQLEGHRRRL